MLIIARDELVTGDRFHELEIELNRDVQETLKKIANLKINLPLTFVINQ